MEQKSKGRPQKAAQEVKRSHYSVWVTPQQKELIDKEIEQTNLSASQFFVVLALNSPIKRPKKKSLPQAVAEQIRNLEKLSGLLALSALKAKDKEMIAENWRESSQNVRSLTQLICAWIFEDFELPQLRKTLQDVHQNLGKLYQYLEVILPQNEHRVSVLETISRLYHKTEEAIKGYDAYFDVQNLPKDLTKISWQNEGEQASKSIQELIDLYFQKQNR